MKFIYDLLDYVGDRASPALNLVGSVGEFLADDVIGAAFESINTVMQNERAFAAVVLSIAAPGAGSALGEAILGSAGISGYPVASTIIGNTIINGVITGDPEQALKSAVAAGIAPQLGVEASKFFENPVAASFVDKMVSAASSAAIQGKNSDQILNSLTTAAIGNATNLAFAKMPQAQNAPPDVKRAIEDAVKTAVQTDGTLAERLQRGFTEGAISYGMSKVDVGGVSPKNLSPETLNIARSFLAAQFTGKPVDQAVIDATTRNLNDRLSRISRLQATTDQVKTKSAEYDTERNKVAELQNSIIADEEWLNANRDSISNLSASFDQKRNELLDDKRLVDIASRAYDYANKYNAVSPGYDKSIDDLAKELGWKQGVAYYPRVSDEGYNIGYIYVDPKTNAELASITDFNNAIASNISPLVNKLNSEAPKLQELGNTISSKIEEYRAVDERYNNNINEFKTASVGLQDLAKDIGSLVEESNGYIADINALVSDIVNTSFGAAEGLSEGLVDDAAKLIADSQQAISEAPTQVAQQKEISDSIFDELKEIFADADPKELRSIADTVAADTVRSDVTEPTDDIDRFKKALQPGGMQIFTESQAEGLRNVVNQMRAAGISDDIIEEELVKAQSRDPNFSSFLQSKSPTALSNLPVKMQPRENEVADNPIVDADGTVRVTIRGKTETGQEYSYVSVMDPEDKSVFYEAASIDPSGGGRTTVSDTRPSFDKGTEQATTIKSPEEISKPTLPDKPIGSIFGYGFEPDSAAGRTLFGPGAKGGGPDLGEIPLLFRLVTVDPGTGLKVYDTNNPEFSLLVLKDGTMKLANNTYPPIIIDLTSSEAGEVAPSVAAADTRAEAEQRQQAAADEAAKQEAARKTEQPAKEEEQSPIKDIIRDVLTAAATEQKPTSEPPKPVEEVKPTPEPVAPEKPVEEVKPVAPQGPVAEVVTPPVQPTPVQPTPAEPTPAAPTPVQPTPVQPTPVQPVPAGVSQQEMQDAINKAVGDAQAEGKAGDAALQAGIDKVASDLGITKDIVLESVGKSEAQLRQEMQAGQAQTAGQIAETEKTLRTEIGKLGTDFQSKFDAMSDAQKAEVDARAKQGQDLQTAINEVGVETTKQISDVKSSLEKQIGDLGTATQQQYNNLSDAQKAEVENRIKQGEDLQKAISDVGQQTTEKIASVEKTVSTGIESLDKRISDLQKEGKTYQEATTQALTELGGQFESYKSAQEKAAEDAKKAAEEAAKEEEEKTKSKNLFNLGLSLLGGAGMAGASPLTSLISGAGTTSAAPPPYPQEIRGLRTGESSGTEFESPLAAFQRLVDPRLAPAPTQEPKREEEMGYFSYGQDTNVEDVLGLNEESQVEAASGGSIVPMMAKGGLSMVHYAGKPRIDFRQGSYVQGPGDGQSDDIPAMLADGEYVFDAEIVSALGNGSNKAGAQLLDKMREHIRAHKRSGSLKKIPPPAKSPLEYLAMAKKGK